MENKPKKNVSEIVSKMMGEMMSDLGYDFSEENVKDWKKRRFVVVDDDGSVIRVVNSGIESKIEED